MLRKVVAASLILVFCVGVTFADELFGRITKVEGNKVTFTPFKGKEKGEEQTFTVSKNVKVVKGKFNKETKSVEAGDELEGGLKHKMFKDIGEKGIFAQIVTDDNKIKEIRVMQRKGKKKE